MKRKLSVSKKSSKSESMKESVEDLFPPVPDWALEDEHEPQSFSDFVDMERWKLRTKSRRTIYLLPLGMEQDSPLINHSIELLAIYFQMQVKVMTGMPIVYQDEDNSYNIKSKKYNFPITHRLNEYGHVQLYDLEILNVLTEFVPKDAYCLLALVNYDIYEWDDSKSIIMGRGTGDRVGLLSYYRFNTLLPSLKKVKKTKKQPSNAIPMQTNQSIMINDNHEFRLNGTYINLLAAAKTMLHETMHMFGLDHCGYYHCVMNANVSPDDDSIDPIHLCPIDIHKLQHAIGFDEMKRYKELLTFYQHNKWEKEANWIAKRIKLFNQPQLQ